MPDFTCFRLHERLNGIAAPRLGDFIAPTLYPTLKQVDLSYPDFTALVVVAGGAAHAPLWVALLQPAFTGQTLALGTVTSTGAVVIVKHKQVGFFAFCFGVLGRHLLKDEAWVRSFGLRSALNLIYPTSGNPDTVASRLVATDAKRRGAEIIRSRRQASRLTSPESLDVDRDREVLRAATGVPEQTPEWGARVTGDDAFHFTSSDTLKTLGDLCVKLERLYARTDYAATFGWIDQVQTVTDPQLKQALADEVIRRLKSRQIEDLDLAPPEVVDWTRVESFKFHWDRNVTRPLPRLVDYLTGMVAKKSLSSLNLHWLQYHDMIAVDGDRMPVARWSIWRCLSGEITYQNQVYILDEGEFASVAPTYLAQLDQDISGIADRSGLLPDAPATQPEPAYNVAVAHQHATWLLLDRKTVKYSGSTTPVEVCDLLTDARELIHVKRHLGSSDLSHLFAQGLVSASLLQESQTFLTAVHAKITSLSTTSHTQAQSFGSHPLVPGQFEVVYAIIADWKGRPLQKALPFFSKINLRHTEQTLRSRGFRVSHCKVQAI